MNEIKQAQLVKDFTNEPGNRRFTVVNGLGKSLQTMSDAEVKKLRRAIRENEDSMRVISVDEAFEPTSPYSFRMKPMTQAVHFALRFYSAWNWMKNNGEVQ